MTFSPAQIIRAQELRHSGPDERVEFVTELVIGLVWTLDNKRELAHIWGIGPREINRLGRAADASVISKIRDPEELRSKLMEQAHFVVSDAMQKKKPFVDKNGNIVLAPDPDHKAALQGINQIYKMSGLDKVQPEEPDAGKYAGHDLDHLLAIAQKKLLPEGQPLESLDIQTEGEEADEEEAEAVEVAISNPDRRRGSEERIRGANTRRDRDPTGRGRGLSQEGRET